MALIELNNPVTAIPELDIYGKAPVQTSIEKTYTDEVRPVSQLNTGGHIEFIINNSANEYVKLKETTLYIRFRAHITKTDKTPIVAADWAKLSLVNNFLHSLWSQIDLIIGDSQTTTSLQTYPYRAYLETILGSTPQGRKSYLESQLFYEDAHAESDAHYAKLKTIIASDDTDGTEAGVGRAVECIGRLHLDMLMQDRALIGGTKIRLRLIPNRPQFYLMMNSDKIVPSIHFEDVILNLVKFRVSDETMMAQMHALTVSPAKYIISRSEVRTHTIEAGAITRSIENVLNGQMPRRVFVGFVLNETYAGSFTKNPYNFQHHNVSSIACYVNGEQIPKRAYTPDFGRNLYLREFVELYKITEQYDNDARMMITKDNFKNGYTLFAFSLSQDLSQGYSSAGYVNLPQDGVMRFKIKFASALTAAVNVVFFCEFDNQISVAEDRNAVTDFR